MAKRKPRNQGKTEFVERFLRENPLGNVSAVVDAWKASGKSGTISGTLISKMRSHLGLTGNLRGRPRKGTKVVPGKKRGPRPKGLETSTAAAGRVETRGRKSNRDKALLELESEIDRLLFRIMEMGSMPEIEKGLRDARRLIYAAHGL